MGKRRYRVLLIEDEEVHRQSFEQFVRDKDLPYDYTIVGSISEANSVLAAREFDVVIVDYRLSDGTVLNVLDSVKTMPVVLMTGAGEAEVDTRAMKAGACDCLIKSLERDCLESIPKAVENALKNKLLNEIIERKHKNVQAIFDAVPVGMLLADENMIVVRVNNATRQMVGKGYLEIINRSVCDALGCVNAASDQEVCSEDPSCSGCLLRKAVESGLDSQEPGHEIEIQPTLRVNGTEVTPWLSAIVEPVSINDQSHVVIAIDDISERKQAEEKLKETIEMKSQFISTVSHELRTPLTCMKEALALVLDGVAGQISEKQKHFLDIAKRNIDRLARLINDVLNFQKLEAGRVELNIKENDIVEVAKEVHKTMLPNARQKGIELSLELRDNLPRATFDRDKIIQVLTNLIVNAIKFTPERGRVSICILRQNDDLVMHVSDNGIGIPKKELPKIFERFFRVSGTGKEISGTGLGLAIVNKIVMLHGGRIEVESQVSKGSTFTVFLPLTAKYKPQVSPEQADQVLEKTMADN